MSVEESIVIDRPPQEVSAFFEDRANDARWMASVVESEWLDQDVPTGVGRRGRMVMKLHGRGANSSTRSSSTSRAPVSRTARCRARW